MTGLPWQTERACGRSEWRRNEPSATPPQPSWRVGLVVVTAPWWPVHHSEVATMKTRTTTKTAKKAQTSKPTAKAKRKPLTQKRLASSARSPARARTETSDAGTASDQRRTSKKATIEALVRRSEGAAITELIAAPAGS